MISHQRSRAALSISRYMKLAGLLILVLMGGVGGWAVMTNIAGAVVASGVFVVDSHIKTIQHSTGGIVGEILVKEGQKVAAGDTLMRLDGTQAVANLDVVKKRLREFYIRLARLEAERDNMPDIAFPQDVLAMTNNVEVMAAVKNEKRLFLFRKKAREGQKEQLLERIAGYENEILGLGVQETAYERGIILISDELNNLKRLQKDGFVTARRLNELDRDVVGLRGAKGEAIASRAKATGQIAETKLQILQIEQELRSEVTAEIRDLQGQIGEFKAREVVAEDTMQRLSILAPQDGIIHHLSSHTIGGVVSPGDPIMQLVPYTDTLTLDVKITPQDIDQIWLGQKSVIRLSAFNQRTTPEINGMVDRIGADLTQDEVTGLSFYTIRITVPGPEMDVLGDLSVVPGMPAEVFLQTNERPVISYLLKPLTDHLSRAFREE